MTKDEALRLALEAFNKLAAWNDGEVGSHMDEPYSAEVAREAITAIKATLEAKDEPVVFSKQNYLNGYFVGQTDLLADQAKQEPLAWMVYTQEGQSAFVTDNPAVIHPSQRALPLYATPPQRKPLTDEEIDRLFFFARNEGGFTTKETFTAFARGIEAAHGIKGEA